MTEYVPPPDEVGKNWHNDIFYLGKESLPTEIGLSISGFIF